MVLMISLLFNIAFAVFEPLPTGNHKKFVDNFSENCQKKSFKKKYPQGCAKLTSSQETSGYCSKYNDYGYYSVQYLCCMVNGKDCNINACICARGITRSKSGYKYCDNKC
eukprot:NODE_284_length_11815_cov_0.176340.p3 type:complete len:110 gc:universal NODE_284_length_11815_cov_0.176340:9968-9639(-)